MFCINLQSKAKEKSAFSIKVSFMWPKIYNEIYSKNCFYLLLCKIT